MRIITIIFILLLVLISSVPLFSQKILIYMDLKQTDHLKAYGVAYWTLKQEINIEWLLNYRGGSFLVQSFSLLKQECQLRGVTYEEIDAIEVNNIYSTIEENNMEKILLEKAPKIAVYTPPNSQPWDDAVTLALTYAEIPYDVIYDEEVVNGELSKYDWLHLHHEDFTGQYGKFWGAYQHMPWYREQVRVSEEMAKQFGFMKVSELKLYVVKTF